MEAIYEYIPSRNIASFAVKYMYTSKCVKTVKMISRLLFNVICATGDTTFERRRKTYVTTISLVGEYDWSRLKPNKVLEIKLTGLGLVYS